MNIQELRSAFERWTPFAEAPPALITALQAGLDEPSTELDTLFRDVVYVLNEASDGFWINYAVQYAPQAKAPETALEYLEYIVGHPERYGVL